MSVANSDIPFTALSTAPSEAREVRLSMMCILILLVIVVISMVALQITLFTAPSDSEGGAFISFLKSILSSFSFFLWWICTELIILRKMLLVEFHCIVLDSPRFYDSNRGVIVHTNNDHLLLLYIIQSNSIRNYLTEHSDKEFYVFGAR